MILMQEGSSDYRIVIAQGAGEAVRYAADELARYLEMIGGARIPVVCDGTEPADREIVIGKTSREGAPCGAGLRNDGYIWKTEGERLFILGENDRGNLYGVYHLLENELGCRFFCKAVERIPARSRVELPPLDRTVIPPLEYREAFWFSPERFPDVAVKRGFNSSFFHKLEEKHGGDIRYWGFGHTLFNYVNPDEYFDEHPEYFSMVNGERLRERTQLCLTNPEVLEITRRKLRQNIIDHPECRIFSLTQMDWYNPCTCPECARVDEEEGSHAGTMIRFVNACAASVAEEFPHVIIDTFAYQYTRQAPKLTRPLPNVCVRICSIECCFSHPLTECNEIMFPFRDKVVGNARFQDDIRDWARICSRMFMWDYTTNYRHYLSPFPNFHVLQDNMKFFLENGVTGLFEQGNAQADSGEFGDLRMYILSRLMWEPEGDVELWMGEFLAGCYGMAAAPLRRYIALLTDHVREADVHMGIYDDPSWFITGPMLEAADALWDEAEALADDEAVLRRVRKARLQVRYARLCHMPAEDPVRAQQLEELWTDMRAHGITHIRETRPLE